MKRDRSFYERILFRYLALYGLLHLSALLYFIFFETDGVGLGFLYILLFWIHVPAMLIASLFALLGKRFRKPWLWCLACLGFFLSNVGWIDMVVQSRGVYYWELLLWGLTTIVPIFCTAKLFFSEET